jgi:very-short-patch-repair endonuclease
MQGPPVTEVLRRLDGAARARDLAALCGRTALRRAYEAGDVVRVGYGRYALPGCEDPWRSALRLSGVISHLSAAQIWGLDVLTKPSIAHATVGRHRHGIDSRGVVLHWADLRPDQLDERGRVTSPLRTVLDCARSLPFAEGLAVADSALRTGLVSAAELVAVATAMTGAGRQRVLNVAERADGRAGSVLESGLRAILLGGAVSGFIPQLAIRDEELFARVDLGNQQLRIVLEADSFEHHGSRTALVRDCRRYDELTIRGWLVLRFAWEHVMFEPSWVLAMVEAAVARAGTRHLGGPKSARRTANRLRS